MEKANWDEHYTTVFAVAGWTGSAHDTRILNDTLTKYAHRFPKPPEGKYYLVDSGYPNRKGYLAPYKGQIYHLPEFRNGQKPVGKHEVYNYVHAKGGNIIERNFGVLKAKFRILKGMPSFKPRRQKKIIIACMSLHNYTRQTKLPDKEFDKCDEDEDYIPGGEDYIQGDEVASKRDAV